VYYRYRCDWIALHRWLEYNDETGDCQPVSKLQSLSKIARSEQLLSRPVAVVNVLCMQRPTRCLGEHQDALQLFAFLHTDYALPSEKCLLVYLTLSCNAIAKTCNCMLQCLAKLSKHFVLAFYGLENFAGIQLMHERYFLPVALRPIFGSWSPLRGFAITLILDTPHSVGLPWTSDQPDAEISTWQHTTITRDRRPCLRWDSNPRSQQANGHRPTTLTARPLGSAWTVFLL
jgi:hypothetical protein